MSANSRRQAGNILMPVILIGLTTSLIMGALINQSVYLEAASVENSLAQSRAYWATMGHFRYALSRVRHAGLCPNVGGCISTDIFKDTDLVPALQSYLDEISALRIFTYPDENSGYTITINLTGTVDDDPTRQNFSGHLMMTSSYPTTGLSLLPVLSGLAQRFTPYQIRFCTGLASVNAPCGGISTNNGGQPTGFYSVKRFYRMPSAS